MNDKEFDLTMLENADNETIKQIAENCPASNVEMERMFAMSRKIYNERTKESNNKDNIEVSGVEQYKKPVWQKFAAIAAALVITGGAVAGGMLFMKNRNTFNNDPVPVVTDPATSPSTEASTEPATKTEESCPFGDISNEHVRLSYAAIAPAVVDLKSDFVKELAEGFNKGKWTELSDARLFDGEFVTLYVYNNGKPFRLEFCLYDTDADKGAALKYSDGKDLWYYTGDETVAKTVQKLYSYGYSESELIIPDDANANDIIKKVWEKDFSEKDNAHASSSDKVEVPKIVGTQNELAKVQLQERGLNYNIIKKSDNTVQPGYVIKVEPAEGTLVSKETVITLYVSEGDTSNEGNNGNTEVVAEDAELIAKAQKFYENAIDTDLKYGRFAPEHFNIDTLNCFEQVNGPYLSNVYDVTLDELRAQYHEVFSDRYAENDATIEKYYCIYNGQLCWLTGNPGIELYLESTTVTKVLRRTDDEIFFAVERHYSDFRHVDIEGDFEPYTETDEFSAVIQPDGSWKVGKFHNPYPN